MPPNYLQTSLWLRVAASALASAEPGGRPLPTVSLRRDPSPPAGAAAPLAIAMNRVASTELVALAQTLNFKVRVLAS